MRTLLFVASTLLVGTLPAFLSSAPARANQSLSDDSSGLIAFSASPADGVGGEIYTATSAGAKLHRLSGIHAADRNPSWSPDGKWIVYVNAGVGQSGALMRMTSRGTKRQILLREPVLSRSPIDGPTWSPDGRRIAFTSSRLGQPEVWMFSFGGGLRRVASRFSVHPTWSPTGTRLAYGGLKGIVVMKVDGSQPHVIRGTTARDEAPVWSRDGRWIAVRTLNRSWRKREIDSLEILTPTGQRRRRLLHGGIIVPQAWSPTSDAILFFRTPVTPGGPRQLYIVSLAGGPPRPVPNTTGATVGADWHK